MASSEARPAATAHGVGKSRERRRLPAGDFPAFLRALPFAIDVNARYLNLPEDQLVARIERELLLVNALRREDGFLVAG